MGRWKWRHRAALASLTAAAIAAASLTVAPAASAAAKICTSTANPALAAKLSKDITSSYRGRTSRVAVEVADPAAGIGVTCGLNAAWRFYSASTVKATILAALLRKADEQHRSLTAKEKSEAWSMITVSDNDAASYLWDDVGMWWLQHFLNLAHMTRTTLGTGGYWGLTLETADDESLLLHLLVNPNPVLTPGNRSYALHLMANVVASQRWGTPAGVPSGFAVHVKNGWLPVPGYGWFIDSLGAFTKTGQAYTVDILTDRNSTMSYGVTTVQDIARVINRDLHSSAASRVPPSAPSATWGQPDETIPATLPARPPQPTR
jgi:beta-lactamase class A